MIDNSLDKLKQYIKQQEEKRIVLVCIGNSQIIGDAFGPLIGTNLKYLLKGNKNCLIIGDIQNNVVVSNIKEQLRNISKDNNCIIVLDSAVSSTIKAGTIVITNTKTKIGEVSCVNNNELGDISIKAVVTNSFGNVDTLRNVSTNVLYPMVETTTMQLYEIIKNR